MPYSHLNWVLKVGRARSNCDRKTFPVAGSLHADEIKPIREDRLVRPSLNPKKDGLRARSKPRAVEHEACKGPKDTESFWWDRGVSEEGCQKEGHCVCDAGRLFFVVKYLSLAGICDMYAVPVESRRDLR